MPGARLRCAALGAAAGGALALPLGAAELWIQGSLGSIQGSIQGSTQARRAGAAPPLDGQSAARPEPEELEPRNPTQHPQSYRAERYSASARDNAAAVIAQLEGSLASSPMREPAPAPSAPPPPAEAEAPARQRARRWWGSTEASSEPASRPLHEQAPLPAPVPAEAETPARRRWWGNP